MSAGKKNDCLHVESSGIEVVEVAGTNCSRNAGTVDAYTERLQLGCNRLKLLQRLCILGREGTNGHVGEA